MPNWCNNVAIISHANPKIIKRLVKAFKGTGLMQEFYPCPQELRDTVAGSLAETDPKYAAHIEQQAANKVKYGCENWYDWQVDHWGTKWDVSQQPATNADMSECGRTVTLSFDTAWSPPLEFYAHMVQERGLRIKAYYFEPGVGFCGQWVNGRENFYDIAGDSSWVIDNIPGEIDEMFSISEHMSDYEAEEEEEEIEEEEEEEEIEEEDEEEVSDDA